MGPLGLAAFARIPLHPTGMVIFAHGSGSGRLSTRNNQVAEALYEAGLASLLLDLLTPAEESDRRYVFDVALLGGRLLAAHEWLSGEATTADLPVGYFGASTGGGAALVAAAEAGPYVKAVVSRGGRPDLAGPVLADVTAPTLLIVGSNDGPVVDLNRKALGQITAEKKLTSSRAPATCSKSLAPSTR